MADTTTECLTGTVTVRIPFLPWIGRAALEISVSASVPEGLRLKAALEIAVRNGASLVGARLDGASLDGASLVGARLDGASLDGASLVGARLDGASLVGARLDGASLVGARLVGARLDGASLDGAGLVGASLVGERPILMIGPLGRESRYLTAYLTDAGIKIRTGCFFGSLDRFRGAVASTHGEGVHAREYAAAIAMIEAHAAAWPALVVPASVAA